MVDSVRQWKRQAEVTVGGKAGQAIQVNNLRITFEVVKTLTATPNTAVIKIYNLSPDNEARIKNEFDEVILNAGYEGGVEMLFRGNIKHVYRYREGNDRITEIEAGDGDNDYRNATVNATLAAGTSNAQLLKLATDSFSTTTLGEVQVPERARIRGKVLTGNTRDILDGLARQAGANWSIQDGQVTVIGANNVATGVAIVLNADTGLTKSPEVNDKGVGVQCLLNPRIKVNVALKLDNNSVRARREKVDDLGKPAEKQGPAVRLDPDGIYKTIKVTHKGDTRGQDWHSDVVCVGLDQPIPSGT